MKGNNECRMIADLHGLSMWVIAVLVFCVAPPVIFIDGFESVRAFTEDRGSVIFLSIIEGVTIPMFSFVLPRFFVMVTIDEIGVRYKVLFHKSVELKWDELYGAYPATYPFRGEFPPYFVFTKKPLSRNDLKNINQIQTDKNFLKIRVTKRNYKKLRDALPVEYRHVLVKAYQYRFVRR